MTYKYLGGLAGCLLLLTPASALAARVSVEIEGQSVIQAPTVVDTAASVSKPGGVACSGALPATALETAVAGDWDGPNDAVTRIKTEDHPFATGQPSWSLFVNGKYSNGGVCDAQLVDGDKVLLYLSNAYASSGFDEPVELTAPATATPGIAFTVSAVDANTTFDPSTYAGTTTLTPSAGATISGGTAPVTTGADGTAQVTVPAGPYTLVARKANRAPTRIAGCATTGSDGFCGTTAAAGAPAPTPSAPAPCQTNGHDGFCGTADRTAPSARITAIAEGRRYARGRGPRQLGGTVAADGSGLADVRLRLTRNDRGTCATYDGRTEKFKAMKKCGAARGTWFSVGAKADWSYLLPSALPRGRYVLDVIAVDRAGNEVTSLARGTTRVVFTVA